MKRILIAVILILGLLLVPSVVEAASGIVVVDKSEEDGVWIDDTWEVEIYPGETKSTTINLHNSSSSSLDVWVSLSSESLDSGNITFGVSDGYFTMPGGSYEYVTLTVRANGSATPGTYTSELEIKSEVIPSRPSGGGGFGITRYLKVDLWGEDFKTRVTSAGEVRADLEAVSIDEMVTLYITKGVLAQTEDEKRLKKIVVLPMEESPPAPKKGYIIGIAYDFSPADATFDPFIELEIRYDHYILPTGVAEKDLVIAYYDEEVGEWLELDGVVDTVGNTITAEVSHFTAFAILGYRVPPAPAAFTISKLIISPAEVDIDQSVTISAIVTNTGGEVGIYEVVLEVDGIVEDTEKVVVSAGASKKVTFTTAKDMAGSYSVDVNGLSGSFTVKAVPPPPPPTPTPTPTLPEKPLNWLLIGAIIAGVVVVIVFFTRRYWLPSRE